MDDNHLGEYEDILKDKNRIEPFIEAITRNKHLFKGKVVLDLDAGLGLLSVLASRAGAKQIYATRASPYAAEIMKQNAVDNVTLFQESLEKVELEGKVDIIISAWMGNMLFYGSRIQELIHARDKYLVEKGLIFPDQGRLYMQSIEDGKYREDKLKFWDSVYGVQMKWMKQWVTQEPLLESLKEEQLNSDSCLIYSVDLYTCKVEDLTFSNSYQLKVKQQDFATGVIVWMQYSFTSTHLPINTTMGPTKSPFWKPVILYFRDEIPVYKGDKISGSLAMKFNSEDILDIKLSANLHNHDSVQCFRLN